MTISVNSFIFSIIEVKQFDRVPINRHSFVASTINLQSKIRGDYE